EFLVVIVDASDGRNAGILVRWNLRTAALFLVPVVNAANERRNQGYCSFSTRDRLGKTEQKCEIAVDAFLLKKFGCPDALPRAGDLDQDAFAGHGVFLIQRD